MLGILEAGAICTADQLSNSGGGVIDVSPILRSVSDSRLERAAPAGGGMAVTVVVLPDGASWTDVRAWGTAMAGVLVLVSALVALRCNAATPE
jgi:hypothetical protein